MYLNFGFNLSFRHFTNRITLNLKVLWSLDLKFSEASSINGKNLKYILLFLSYDNDFKSVAINVLFVIVTTNLFSVCAKSTYFQYQIVWNNKYFLWYNFPYKKQFSFQIIKHDYKSITYKKIKFISRLICSFRKVLGIRNFNYDIPIWNTIALFNLKCYV